ncbi:MAG TPA: tRNA pseudouridine(13) synthase TruD [Steroidobacteraceae bacterium]|nr:tRNA pseudouridine(13) synthase TruD [Steroidobacteraceae bacterium]
MNVPVEMMALPCAHGGPAGRAQLRSAPEDFLVQEWLGWEPDGEGDHLLLKVRKRGANTVWVAKQFARLAKLDPRDVGFAGLKDRDAVAEQSFTVPARSAIGEAWMGVAGEGFEVVSVARHRRKLKRGALKGNDFTITLRSFSGDAAALDARLRAIAAAGAPNYFGPQRFGRDGSNLRTALAWFSEGVTPVDRWQRGFALSAARAAIFNAVVARRVGDGTWNRLLPGEIVNLDGSGSVFVAEVLDATLEERCSRLDIHPTGPMWGGRQSPHAASALEAEVVARHDVLAQGLSKAGLEYERRALRIRVDRLEWTIHGEVVQLRFRLHRGAFATAVLHELIDNAFAQQTPEGDE